MLYLGDYADDATIDFMWSTNGADGASITRSVNGTVSVYKANGTTQTTTGVTDTEDFDSLTGIHHCRIVTTDAFYATGNDYMVVLSAATIDTKTVNSVLAMFSIQNRYHPTPPTAAAIADQVWDEARSGHVTGGSFGEGVVVNSIAAGAVTAAAIATGAIDADAIADNAIDAGAIATGAITAAKFAAGAIDAAAIAANAIDASALATDAVAEIVDAVWDEDIAGHQTAQTTGAILEAAGSDWSETIADAVWDEALAGHVAAGSAGEALGDVSGGSSPSAIADAVWDEALAGHGTAGTTGEALDWAKRGIRVFDSANAAENMKKWFSGEAYNAAGATISTVGTVTNTVNANVVNLNGSATDFDKLLALFQVVIVGTVTAGTNTTTVVTAAGLSASADFYKDKTFIARTGVNAGQGGKLVTDYDGATKRLTIEALTAAMAVGDKFVLVG